MPENIHITYKLIPNTRKIYVFSNSFQIVSFLYMSVLPSEQQDKSLRLTYVLITLWVLQ